mgnify:CR=1 FL=1
MSFSKILPKNDIVKWIFSIFIHFIDGKYLLVEVLMFDNIGINLIPKGIPKIVNNKHAIASANFL